MEQEEEKEQEVPVGRNSMYIEVENDEEILRLQQEIIKSNIPIEDVAKIVGKLEKLRELTKHNTNKNYTDIGSFWKQYYDYGQLGGGNYYHTTPTILPNANPLDASQPIMYKSSSTTSDTQTIDTSSGVVARNDIPF